MIKLTVNTRSSNDGSGKTLYTLTQFNEISLNIKYDSVASTFKFKMFFDPNNPDHAELAGVSHMHECKIYYVHDKPGRYAISEKNGKAIFGTTTDELIITGFVLSQLLEDSPAPTWVEIGGYSKPGVLGDCDFPTNYYPLESVGLSFRQIVNQKVIPIFSDPASGGFKFYIKSSRADSVFETDINKKVKKDTLGLPASVASLIESINSDADDEIGKTTAPESKNILSYLMELAVQKGLILSTDIFGNLIINEPYLGDDYLFEIGTANGIPITKLTCNYNGQSLHSDIEVVGQPDKDGGNMAYALVKNPLVPVVYRPKVVTMQSGNDNDAKKAGLAELGTELKSIPLKIILDSPVVNGRFILPNNTIKVKDRSGYIYDPSKWLIEEVVYNESTTSKSCEVTAVLPGVYGGPIINVFVPAGKDLPNI
jgi:hypothetical protein